MAQNETTLTLSAPSRTFFSCKKALTYIPAVELKTFTSILDVSRKDWCAIVPASQTFMQYDYLLAIENAHKPQLGFRYVMVLQDQVVIAVLNCQIVTFSVEKVRPYIQIADASTAWDKFKNIFSYRLTNLFSWLRVRMLVGGNVFLTGTHGFAYSDLLDEAEAQKLLSYALDQLCEIEKQAGAKISAVLVKDFYPSGQHPTGELSQKGYHPFAVDPLMEMRILPEWKTFEDYLAALGSKYRQRAKSAFKKSQSLASRELSYADIEANLPQINHLFHSVIGKAGFNLQESSDDFILHLKREMGGSYQVQGYFWENKLVAFCSLLKGEETFEAYYLGYEEQLNHEYKIYQRILYDLIRWSIEARTPHLVLGRTALEIKTTVGAVARPMHLYLRLNNQLLNRIAAPLMRNIKNDAWTARHPFKGQEALEGDG